MNRRLGCWLLCGLSTACYRTTLTPGVVGCYEVETPTWSSHLRPHPEALPRFIMLDSAEAAERRFYGAIGLTGLLTGFRRGWPWSDSVTITWTNEHSEWLLAGDTVIVPRDPAFHRLPNDSIVVRMSGKFGGFVAQLAADQAGFSGLAFHRDERTLRQYSMPLSLRRTMCSDRGTSEQGTGAT